MESGRNPTLILKRVRLHLLRFGGRQPGTLYADTGKVRCCGVADGGGGAGVLCDDIVFAKQTLERFQACQTTDGHSRFLLWWATFRSLRATTGRSAAKFGESNDHSGPEFPGGYAGAHQLIH